MLGLADSSKPSENKLSIPSPLLQSSWEVLGFRNDKTVLPDEMGKHDWQGKGGESMSPIGRKPTQINNRCAFLKGPQAVSSAGPLGSSSTALGSFLASCCPHTPASRRGCYRDSRACNWGHSAALAAPCVKWDYNLPCLPPIRAELSPPSPC